MQLFARGTNVRTWFKTRDELYTTDIRIYVYVYLSALNSQGKYVLFIGNETTCMFLYIFFYFFVRIKKKIMQLYA